MWLIVCEPMCGSKKPTGSWYDKFHFLLSLQSFSPISVSASPTHFWNPYHQFRRCTGGRSSFLKRNAFEILLGTCCCRSLPNQLFYSTLWGELLCNSISTVEKAILTVTCHGQVDKIDWAWITNYAWFKVWPEISTSISAIFYQSLVCSLPVCHDNSMQHIMQNIDKALQCTVCFEWPWICFLSM